MLVLISKISFVAGTREVEEKPPFRDAWSLFQNCLAPELPGESRHVGDDCAGGVAIGSKRKIQISEEVLHLKAVGIQHRPLQHAFGDLETDKGAIFVGSVPALRDLQDIEAKFGSYVREGIIPICNDRTKSGAKLGI